MRRLLLIACFVPALPGLLLQWGIHWIQDRIEDRWPDSHRAQVVRLWIGLLAPLVVIATSIAVCVALSRRVNQLAPK